MTPEAPSDDKYEKLKRKYSTFMEVHRKLIQEYDIALDTISRLSHEKGFLKNKLQDILQKAGFDLSDIEGLDDNVPE